MKKYLFLIFVLVSTPFLHAVIIETDHFAEIEKYIDQKTLVLLDIDDTLLIPKQMLGSDAWFCYRIRQYEKMGEPKEEALEKALADWQAVRFLTHMEIVEPGTEKIVQKIQDQGIAVMGFTTQGLALATRTLRQLLAHEIDLSRSMPSKEDCYFMNTQGVLYRKGILFTSGTHKGQALLKYLDANNLTPKKIVFINDKKTHLAQVEHSLEERGIPFIGLRYTYSDGKVSSFDPEIADIQWKLSQFHRILSDEEAQNLLNN